MNELTSEDRKRFQCVLTNVFKLLSDNDLSQAQSEVVEELINQVNQGDERFLKQVNSIDMWGGSGAVWEVHFEDTESARSFEIEMIKLIDLMEETNLLGKGIKPIRKLFKENQVVD